MSIWSILRVLWLWLPTFIELVRDRDMLPEVFF